MSDSIPVDWPLPTEDPPLVSFKEWLEVCCIDGDTLVLDSKLEKFALLNPRTRVRYILSRET